MKKETAVRLSILQDDTNIDRIIVPVVRLFCHKKSAGHDTQRMNYSPNFLLSNQ